MISFELFLIDQGYHVYHMDTKTMKYIPGWISISSMVNIDNRYTEESIIPGKHPTDVIIVGLDEYGFPPYVISPRLKDARKHMTELTHEELLKKLNLNR